MVPTCRLISTILGQEDTSNENLLFFRDNRAIADSCQWLSRKESFRWWRDGETGSQAKYLWLSAPPATGKSVLMSAVIDQLREESEICAFYFFRGNNTASRTTRSFMLSVIAQMAIHSAKFYEQLAEIDDQYTKIQSMPTRVLWQKIFVETLFNLSEGSTAPWYWVLDALDESESASEVISLVGKIQSVTPMRVLMTSRVGMDIQRVLQSS